MASLCPVAPFFCPNKLSGGPSSCFAITIWPKCQLQKKPLQNQRWCSSHTTQPFQCQNGSWNNEMVLFTIFSKIYGHNWKTTIVSSLDDKSSVRYFLALERLIEDEDEGSRSDVNSTMDCNQPRRGSLCSIRLTVEQGEPSKILI